MIPSKIEQTYQKLKTTNCAIVGMHKLSLPEAEKNSV